jgi:hypothetical protein
MRVREGPLKKPVTLEQSEHNFTGNLEDWEERVVMNAVLFRVRRYWRGQEWQSETASFQQAVTAVAMCEDDPKKPGSRAIIHAVTESGRFIAVPAARFAYYLDKLGKRDGKAG